MLSYFRRHAAGAPLDSEAPSLHARRARSRRLAAAAALAVSFAGAGPGARAAPDLSSYSWRVLLPSGPAPSARRDAALVLDRTRDRLVLFGGRSGGTALDDTWALDLATLTWRELGVGDPLSPPARFSLVAGVDSARNRLLVTTGQAATGGFLNDIWSFDLVGERWSLLSPPGTPPSERYGSSGGVFDGPGAGALFLSHGFTSSGRFDDAWAFDLATDTWRDASPGAPQPLRRCLHATTLVAPDRAVLYGGCSSGAGPCPQGDLWLLDDATSTWTELTPASGPAARQFPAIAAIPGSPLVVLFGGQAGAALGDLWSFDLDASAWTALAPMGAPPAARYGHAMVWIEATPSAPLGCGRLFLFGGRAATGDLDDIWILGPPSAADPLIQLVKTGASVILSWPADAAGPGYEVWRGTRRDIAPGDGDAVLLTGPVVIDAGIASTTDAPPDPLLSYYYKVRSTACPD